jgi:hypothetical protein
MEATVSAPLQGLRMEIGWVSLTQAAGLGCVRSPLWGWEARAHEGCPYASWFGGNVHGGDGPSVDGSPYGERPCGRRGPRDSFRP